MLVHLKVPALVFAGLLLAQPAQGQSGNPAWLDDLKSQLQVEERCGVELFLNIHEGKLGSGNSYEARVRCRDGRMFDASRIDPDKKFTIKACKIAVC